MKTSIGQLNLDLKQEGADRVTHTEISVEQSQPLERNLLVLSFKEHSLRAAFKREGEVLNKVAARAEHLSDLLIRK
jgi:hypothetical protein